jgi:hypothetical protein
LISAILEISTNGTRKDNNAGNHNNNDNNSIIRVMGARITRTAAKFRRPSAGTTMHFAMLAIGTAATAVRCYMRHTGNKKENQKMHFKNQKSKIKNQITISFSNKGILKTTTK